MSFHRQNLDFLTNNQEFLHLLMDDITLPLSYHESRLLSVYIFLTA